MQLSELELTQTEYFRLQLHADRDVLLLVFSHLEEPVGRFSLQQTVTKIGASSVLMNTVPRSYYAEGVPGLGDGIAATAAGLRRIVEAVRPRAVVTLGISMGGYAALMFGALLHADRILAFSPETRLLLPGSRSSFALRRRTPPEHLDVVPLLQAAPRTKVALYFGEAELHDVYAAWRLRDVSGASLYSVQGGGHEIARWFAERGLLHAMIDDFVHQDRTLEEFPQRGWILDEGAAIEMAMAAQDLLMSGEPLRAMEASRGALLLAPHFDLAYDLLGRAATAGGRLGDAVEAHRSAAAMTPENVLYRLRYGRALLDAGELAKAETVLRAVAEESPKLSAAHQALASVAEKRGDMRAAEAALTCAIACNANDASLLQRLGVLQSAGGRWREAEETYQRAIEINPTQPSFHAQLGRARHALGRAGAAADCYREALRLHPGNAEYRAWLKHAERHLTDTACAAPALLPLPQAV